MIPATITVTTVVTRRILTIVVAIVNKGFGVVGFRVLGLRILGL